MLTTQDKLVTAGNGGPKKGPKAEKKISRSSANASPIIHAPPVDWKETPVAHVIKVDVPGMKKEELNVTVEENDGRRVTVTGERAAEKAEEGEAWRRTQRWSGRFSCLITLPENANVDEVKAVLENGVLTLTVGKVQLRDKKVVRSVVIAD